ncbi:MAG: hypothetical protein CMM52_09520 [Rhodospirillaceae bacterium]|nr:hypothetical protein [Rhodospirillaceae bacterium]|tara:strand:+ start:4066 stop:4662 length:597 start_codon:yes stop_codon:yes gene_type:complete
MIQIWHHQVERVSGTIRDYFDVDLEKNFATWFSTFILFYCSALLFLIAKRKSEIDDQWTRAWYGLSAGFLYMSCDEIAELHETVNSFTTFSWVIPAAIVSLIMGLIYLRFLLHLRPLFRNLFLLSAAIFLGGALGVEYATNMYEENGLLNTLAYNLWTPVEEGMEMGGVILFIYTLLRYSEEDQAAIGIWAMVTGCIS